MMKFLMLCICISVLGCKSSQTQTLNQGIKGQVLWLEGNFMPGPGQEKTGEPVVREIYVYEVINAKKIEEKGNRLYELPDQDPITIGKSDENGLFEIALPSGKYSVFTKEDEGLFANLFDGQMNLNPVEVEIGKFTEMDIKINYKAVY